MEEKIKELAEKAAGEIINQAAEAHGVYSVKISKWANTHYVCVIVNTKDGNMYKPLIDIVYGINEDGTRLDHMTASDNERIWNAGWLIQRLADNGYALKTLSLLAEQVAAMEDWEDK